MCNKTQTSITWILVEDNFPYTSQLEWILARFDGFKGKSKKEKRNGSHWSVSKFISWVRLAFVTSVMYTPPSVPPVKFHSNQVSTVPISKSEILLHIKSYRLKGFLAYTRDVICNGKLFNIGTKSLDQQLGI